MEILNPTDIYRSALLCIHKWPDGYEVARLEDIRQFSFYIWSIGLVQADYVIKQATDIFQNYTEKEYEDLMTVIGAR